MIQGDRRWSSQLTAKSVSESRNASKSMTVQQYKVNEELKHGSKSSSSIRNWMTQNKTDVANDPDKGIMHTTSLAGCSANEIQEIYRNHRDRRIPCGTEGMIRDRPWRPRGGEYVFADRDPRHLLTELLSDEERTIPHPPKDTTTRTLAWEYKDGADGKKGMWLFRRKEYQRRIGTHFKRELLEGFWDECPNPKCKAGHQGWRGDMWAKRHLEKSTTCGRGYKDPTAYYAAYRNTLSIM